MPHYVVKMMVARLPHGLPYIDGRCARQKDILVVRTIFVNVFGSGRSLTRARPAGHADDAGRTSILLGPHSERLPMLTFYIRVGLADVSIGLIMSSTGSMLIGQRNRG